MTEANEARVSLSRQLFSNNSFVRSLTGFELRLLIGVFARANQQLRHADHLRAKSLALPEIHRAVQACRGQVEPDDGLAAELRHAQGRIDFKTLYGNGQLGGLVFGKTRIQKFANGSTKEESYVPVKLTGSAAYRKHKALLRRQPWPEQIIVPVTGRSLLKDAGLSSGTNLTKVVDALTKIAGLPAGPFQITPDGDLAVGARDWLPKGGGMDVPLPLPAGSRDVIMLYMWLSFIGVWNFPAFRSIAWDALYARLGIGGGRGEHTRRRLDRALAAVNQHAARVGLALINLEPVEEDWVRFVAASKIAGAQTSRMADAQTGKRAGNGTRVPLQPWQPKPKWAPPPEPVGEQEEAQTPSQPNPASTWDQICSQIADEEYLKWVDKEATKLRPQDQDQLRGDLVDLDDDELQGGVDW